MLAPLATNGGRNDAVPPCLDTVLDAKGSAAMLVWTIIGWILFGLLVGALARLVVPGRQPIGLLGTILVGVAGSFIGGFAAYLLWGGEPFQAKGWIGSLLGAVLLLVVSGYVGTKSKAGS